MSEAVSELRWVVLWHDGIEKPHFDFMFETSPGSPLRTFRLERWPILSETPCTPLPDHRPVYLNYEGPISGNRGSVSRIAQGTCLHRSGGIVELQPIGTILEIAADGTRLSPARSRA